MCIVMRMARIQLYLQDDLYEQVKARGLAASELFQAAVRSELRRRELEEATDAYLADLPEPTPEETADAQAWVAGLLTAEPVVRKQAG